MKLHGKEILLALQFGDSTFPSGAFTFSWGLEGLVADGLVETKQDVIEIVEQHLVHRWTCMDRVLLAQAYAAASEDDLVAVDRLTEAATWSAAMRVGTRRAGRRLLNVGTQLNFIRTASYRRRVLQAPELGHLPVVQGLMLNEAGLGLAAAELVSAWSTVNGLAAAAVRLGVIGHIEAQDVIGHQRAILESILAKPADVSATPSSFTPLIDIALAKSAGRYSRIFTN